MGMPANLIKRDGFGTAPVFFTSISTILGAIMFLRFGYAVGNLGFIQTSLIVIVGHIVTIPTAMAISEIATNQKVQGGGVYFIISRSFGITIGGAIGIALYLSQAISTAFYVIAFAESFKPIFEILLTSDLDILVYNLRIVSVPATIVLMAVVMSKGASLGVQTLYFVVVILFISIVLFFAGSTEYGEALASVDLNNTVVNGAGFFHIFAICFPAFTGIAAGVGLSGDLKDPSKSIPLGTMAATFGGMIVYLLIAYKLTISASPEDLVNDQLIMEEIALWGPIIPIGLAAATISSAIGSLLVAPRTLQAIAADRIFPSESLNHWLSQLTLKNNEPVNASLITSVITLVFVLIGDIDVVAQIITMFFMVTYGAICSISFFEHFASDPAYRPVFRSRWYVSLIGALSCLYLMFKLSAFYSFFSLGIMVLIYYMISYYKKDKEGISAIFQGVMFQLSRLSQVFLQKVDKEPEAEHWRPSIVCISNNTFIRFSAFNMLRWISHKYGFGTYIHLISGYLSKDTHIEAKRNLNRLIRISESTRSKVYLDTLVSPSFTSAVAQVIQLPGVTGKENNMIMFEFSKKDPSGLNDIIDNFNLINATEFDTCILGSSDRNFGYKQAIDIWITSKDYENANLMILLGFIVLGHPDWKNADIRLLVVYPENELAEQKKNILQLIYTGRLPISKNNVQLIPQKENIDTKTIINQKSEDADLTIIGIRPEAIKHHSEEVFSGYDGIGDVLFIHTSQEKVIR